MFQDSAPRAGWQHGLTVLAISIVAMAVLSGCASPRPTRSTLVTTAPSDPTLEGLLDEYRIGVGDRLRISVWGNQELSGEMVVLPDGKISVPLVGSILAAGETTKSLGVHVADELGKFVRQPEVTVSVVNAASSEYLQRVRITGAVNSPLSLDYRRGMTVLDVVLLAGGVTPYANANRSLLYRHDATGVQSYPIRLEDILTKGILDTNYPLLPADIITVPEKRL